MVQSLLGELGLNMTVDEVVRPCVPDSSKNITRGCMTV